MNVRGKQLAAALIMGTILFSAPAGLTGEITTQAATVQSQKGDDDRAELIKMAAKGLVKIDGYNNLGIAKVSDELNIRKSATTSSKIVGILKKDWACEILTEEKDGWVKVKSGKVTGYVSANYLYQGTKAIQYAITIMKDLTVSETLHTVISGQTVSKKAVELTDSEVQESTETTTSKDEVVAEYGYSVLVKGTLKEAQVVKTPSIAERRAAVVEYAKQFIGNPYRWGGTSLTKGTDCSGFTMSVYQKFGISLPHSSRAQAQCGTSVSVSNLQPGDLVFYGSGSYISHVALYIGDGQVVHASTYKTGIKISSVTYSRRIKAVRVIQ